MSIHFIQHLLSDELKDTLYFATSHVPQKSKTPKSVILNVPKFTVEIVNNKMLYVNNQKFKSVHDVKRFIQNEVV